MDSSKDDGIEVIEEPSLKSRGSLGSPQPLSPVGYRDTGSSRDSLIDPASIPALQEAFVSLQHKHNDLKKKNEDLTVKYNALQRKLLYQKMDFELQDDEFPSVAQAAGAMGGEGASASEQADLGFRKHLMRRVYQGEGLLVKSQEEIRNLKSRNQALSLKVDEAEAEKARMRQDLQTLTDCLTEKRRELDKSQIQIDEVSRQMKVLQNELEKQRSNFNQQEEKFRQTLQEREDNVLLKGHERDMEVQDLRMRLEQANKTIQLLTRNLEEKDHTLMEKEKEIISLRHRRQNFERQSSGKPTADPAERLKFTDLSVQEFENDPELKQLQMLVSQSQSIRQQVLVTKKLALEQEQMLAKLNAQNQYADTSSRKPFPGVRPDVVGCSYQPAYSESLSHKNVGQKKSMVGMDSPPADKMYGMFSDQGVTRSSSEPVFVVQDQHNRKGMVGFSLNQVSSGRQITNFNVTDSQSMPRRNQSSSYFGQQDSKRSQSEIVRASPGNIPTQGGASQTSFHRSLSSQGLPAGKIQTYPARDATYQNMDPDYENISNISRPSPKESSSKSNQQLPDPHEGIRPTIPIGKEDTGSHGVSAVKICPVCTKEFSRLSMAQFQTHVFECFDTCEEGIRTNSSEKNPLVPESNEERSCPMCGQVFSVGVAQEAFEGHVLAHFGEEPTEGFEVLHS